MGQSLVTIQNSLNAGELSPSIWGRTDLEKYHSGCTTARNFFANYRGGMSSRAGLAYVGTCKQSYPVPPRDIPFQFSLNQGFVLEFGQDYMRVKSNGGYVLESPVTVTQVGTTGIVQTSSPHGYSAGDWVFGAGNSNIAGLAWIVLGVIDSTHFQLENLFGLAPIFATTVTGGTVSRIYTAVSPYAAVDLPYLKYTQSADVMTLTCVNTETSTEYPPYSLTRVSNTNWTFTADTFSSSISAPTNLAATAESSSSVTTWYSYVVTAIDNGTGEESNASSPVNIQNVDISLFLGSNTLTWNEVANASSYKIYAATPSYSVNVPVSSLFGYIGTALGPSFTDTNITPDFTQVPPTHSDPFARGTITDVTATAGGNGDYSQQTIGYFITTSTGTGFAGTPVVNNGDFAGFVIIDPGKNYQPTDTITITDSGGGLATGSLTITSLPTNAENFYLNGVKISFSNVPVLGPVANTILAPIEATTALTAQSLANALNAQSGVSLSLSVAQYVASGSSVTITYKTPGSIGNSYTLGSPGGSAPVSFSGSTLSGGGTSGSGATGSLVVSPESGTYPGVAAYYQQRRVYGSSLNNPDTYWMTQPGLFTNMDSSIPVTDADAIIGTPWAQQVNGIQFMVPMPGGLVILTGKGAWQLNGGSQAAITPSNQVATPQAYNGCNGTIPPITINYDILYVQAKGSIFRDLAYNFFTNIYTGTDLTVLSNHLFNDFQMVQAAYAEEPYKLVWVVRNDGKMLCLTYLKEQDVYAWTRHDTDGLFVSVCSITEPPVDAVYCIVQRYVQGNWYYYSERMNNRLWDDIEDTYCVDAGVSLPQTFPSATLNISANTGTVTLTTSSSVFSSGMVGDVVRAGGGKITLTAYTSGTQMTGTVTQTVVDTVPNDPNNLPTPVPSGSWSVSTPVSTVSGLNHLNGLTVTALADGSVVPPQTVTNNSITLPNPASQVTAGLPYTCQVQTVYWEHPSQQGTVQNKRKNISAVGLRVEQSRGIQIGADQIDASTQQFFAEVPWIDMTEVKERTMFNLAGTPIPLYTGDYYQSITSSWDLTGQIAVQQKYPLPANILACIFYVQTGDDK